ncbi:DUF2834 domain-containing protein [Aestuariibacter sp. GS-14]|uniref:DUF2834 domain-containing protein n=1 Tax=Aestuariibacter sp. GS-14 TaxID=2590670 RepID=UPI00112BDF62|nr:DUF2834 domain-containing protein [Aestuariibacter sp. GS-14]
MRASTLFLFIALAGTVIPLKAFVNWLMEYGVHPVLFWQHLTATPLSVFAWLDVFIPIRTGVYPLSSPLRVNYQAF